MKTLKLLTFVALSACVNRHDDVDAQRAVLAADPAPPPARSGASAPPASPSPGSVSPASAPSVGPTAPAVHAIREPTPSTGPAGPARYAVKWSPTLGLQALDQVDARLAAPDRLGFGELERGDEQVLPTSCAQWASLHAAGYVPSTTLEEQPDGSALLRCGTLRALKSAKPARVSFVRELPPPGPQLLRVLPVAVATAESDEREARVQALGQQQAPLGALDPKAKMEKLEPPALGRVREGGGQSQVDLEPLAWADFDGDGVEDVAMSVRNTMTRGSYSTARLLFLTRSDANAVLRVVDVR
jgi:hypothetical protein